MLVIANLPFEALVILQKTRNYNISENEYKRIKMALTYTYESGNIEKESTNRLTNINHDESLYDFYMLHPELSEVWELGEHLEESKEIKHQEAGRAIKRAMKMNVEGGDKMITAHLLKYAKKMNRKILSNSGNDVKKAFAIEFVYSQIVKGFNICKIHGGRSNMGDTEQLKKLRRKLLSISNSSAATQANVSMPLNDCIRDIDGMIAKAEGHSGQLSKTESFESLSQAADYNQCGRENPRF